MKQLDNFILPLSENNRAVAGKDEVLFVPTTAVRDILYSSVLSFSFYSLITWAHRLFQNMIKISNWRAQVPRIDTELCALQREKQRCD